MCNETWEGSKEGVPFFSSHNYGHLTHGHQPGITLGYVKTNMKLYPNETMYLKIEIINVESTKFFDKGYIIHSNFLATATMYEVHSACLMHALNHPSAYSYP